MRAWGEVCDDQLFLEKQHLLSPGIQTQSYDFLTKKEIERDNFFFPLSQIYLAASLSFLFLWPRRTEHEES
jgi:hypothetical protein